MLQSSVLLLSVAVAGTAAESFVVSSEVGSEYSLKAWELTADTFTATLEVTSLAKW